ncbi:hypothetical protein [Corynebacterium sp. H130]|uniref:hypothetical protein n=1 Tax=Corynebacterium sp. H130 TaxID=3133444 RepID=UPI0030958A5F
MRRFAILACTALLVGCSSGTTDKPAPQTIVEVVTEAAPENANTELIDVYSKVLDNPGAYEFNKTDHFTPSGTYSYAIAEVTGDDRPELLVRADVKDYWAPVTVFSKPAGGELFNTKSVVIEGAASAGGGRGQILESKSGTGLYEAAWQSVSPTASVRKFEIRDKELVATGQEEQLPSTNLEDAEHKPIEWTLASDRSALNQLGQGQAQPKAEAKATVVEKCGVVAGVAVATGTSVTSCAFAKSVAGAAQGKTGTFTVEAASPVTGQSYAMNCVGNEAETVCSGGNNAQVVLRPAGPEDTKKSALPQSVEGVVVVKDPMGVSRGNPLPYEVAPGSEYIVLQLEPEQSVTGQKANSSITKPVDSIGLGQNEIMQYAGPDTTGPWRQYVGKRIRLHFDKVYFQTDASLPWGTPRLDKTTQYEVEVLN